MARYTRIYCIMNRIRQNCLEDHEVHKGPSCILNISGESSGAAECRLSPRLDQWFMSKGSLLTTHPSPYLAKISEFQYVYSLLIYQVSDVTKSFSDLNSRSLERQPYPRGNSGVQPTARQESSGCG